MPQSSVQDVQEDEGSGEAGGDSMSLKLPELCAIQSECFHQWP